MVLSKQISLFLNRALLGCENLFTGRLVRIPYSGRFCLVISEEIENFHHQEKKTESFSDQGEGLKLLPSSDWRVRQVESVTKKLIDAMNEGLMLDKGYKINGKMYHSSFSNQDKKQTRLIWKPCTQHLNGKDWDIYVAKQLPGLGLCSDPGRNILICATLLPDHEFPTQAEETEIATIIGHELGHLVAMHGSRFLYYYHSSIVTLPALLLWSLICLGVANSFDLLPVVYLLGKSWICFSTRRHEAEADYIGMMLMASAGYDPRVAPLLCQRLRRPEIGFFSELSGVKRAKLLNRNKVMKEALKIYEDAKAGNGIKRFV